MSQRNPVLSIVDYAAWDKGYLPPSEHVLIDALSYRDARIVMSSSDSRGDGFWLVMKGQRITGRKALAIRQMIEMALDELTDDTSDQLPEMIYPSLGISA